MRNFFIIIVILLLVLSFALVMFTRTRGMKEAVLKVTGMSQK